MSSEALKISIIIPAYNVENYIESALESVFLQKTPAYEVIIVNDGSTDATADKISNYERRNDVQIITTENQGLGPARNEGLKRASGNYVYFFDSDDILDVEFLSFMGHVIKANRDADLVLFSGATFIDDSFKGDKHRDLVRPLEISGIDGNKAVALLVGYGSPTATAWLYVSKRDLWVKNNLSFKNIVHEDDEIFCL